MMTLARPNCPECGEPARGSVERMAGCALFTEPDAQGRIEWAGDTDVWWDEQHTETDAEGAWNLICEQGHEWWSQVTTIEDAAPAPHHERDEDCTVDPATDTCTGCGVLHGAPCPACQGRGFHRAGCLRIQDPSTWPEEATR